MRNLPALLLIAFATSPVSAQTLDTGMQSEARPAGTPIVERWASGQIRTRPAHRMIDDSALVQARNKARDSSLASAHHRLMEQGSAQRALTLLDVPKN